MKSKNCHHFTHQPNVFEQKNNPSCSPRTGANVNVNLIIRQGDQILFHHRKNTGYCDEQYGLLSGNVEDGESVTSAIIREAYEEAGIKVKAESLRMVHIMHRQTNRNNVDFFFECSEWNGTIMNREPEKCYSLDFFSLDKLPINIIDYINDALKAITERQIYSELGW